MLRVKNVLGKSRNLTHYAETHQSVQDISRIMVEKKVSFLPVVAPGGDVVGVVSTHDVIACEMTGKLDTTALDICTKNILSVEPETLTRDAVWALYPSVQL